MAEEQAPKKKFKIPTILVIVWIVIIILFGYALLIDRQDEPKADDELQRTTLEEPTNVNSSLKAMSEAQQDQARIKDSKRLADMKRLRAVLEEFKEAKDFYPTDLESIVPTYLEFVPRDPNGQDYGYTCIGSEPCAYYDMSYVLEIGVEGISPGMHIASPQGIATP